MQQMKVFSRNSLAYFKNKNSDQEKVANGTLWKIVQISLSSWKKFLTKLEEIRLNADPQYSISFNDL